MTFTKLFSSITASTVWCESSDTRVVWITMLAMADRHGRVWASIPGLAKEAAVSVDACRTAIDKFLSPDPDSRTKVAEGRRIEPIDGGWKLINHAKYRAIRDEEERRAYKTEKQREYRGPRHSKTTVDNVDKCGPVLNDMDPRGHNAEAEAEAVKKPSRRKRASDDEKHSSDPRHVACKERIFAAYRHMNNGIDPEWDGREGKALGMLLRAQPSLNAGTINPLLLHWAKSDVNHGDRPSIWIPKLSSFRVPVDRFNKPMTESTNGKGKPGVVKQRLDATRQRLAEIAIERGLYTPHSADGGNDATMAESGDGGLDNGVPRGFRATSPEILTPKG